MKFATPQAFRQALEDRLRQEYPHHHIPRLRKMIAFERFMTRLNEDWVLKGGYALQLRTEQARTTQDIDLLAQPIVGTRIFESLVQQLHKDVGDYFSFAIEPISSDVNLGGSIRFRVTSRVAGRVFERFHVDIGQGDVIVGPIDYLSPPQMLSFAEITSAPFPCYPVTQHIAEKLHALVKPRAVENSRLKDLVDILLLTGLDSLIQADRLRASVEAVFDTRGDLLPTRLGQLPLSWRMRFNRLTAELELPFENLEQATDVVSLFIDPILANVAAGVWNPQLWKWGE
ncbi:MAG: nucleotidyl transferase AbiEii/AbiGii toxin family protein [Candidatus Promineifilaceae bacterium]